MFGRLSKYFHTRVKEHDQQQDGFDASGYSDVSGASAAAKKGAATETIFSYKGTFYYKPFASTRFEPLSAQDVATLSIVSTGRNANGLPQFQMIITDPDETGDEPALEQPISSSMSMTYHHGTGAVMWQCVFDGALRELCFRFTGGGASKKSEEFVDAFNRCVYASLVDMQKEDEEDIDYVKGTFSREQPMRDSKSPEPANNNDKEDEEEIFTFDTTHRERSVAPTTAADAKMANKCFADSVKYNRAIVIRQGPSGETEARAFTYDENGFGGAGEAFLVEEMNKLTINSKKDNQALLGAEERNFYALHDKGGIVDIDLSRGEVVQEYKSDPKYPTIAITNRSKFAENDPNLICCLSNNVAFSIDKRLDPSKCVVAEAGKDTSDYALGSLKKPMTCHATSAKGQLVIGDTAGDLRLYTGPPGTQRPAGGYHPKTAKTLLKGTPNDAIVSVDITADGKYVVAATSDHLMLFPIEYLDGTKTLNGCDARMGKNKPSPLRLVPTADQLRQMKKAPNFTSVRFDANKQTNATEWIVATCNEFILTFKMSAVLKALDTNRTVSSDAIREDANVKQVEMQGGREAVTFMTEHSIGKEHRSAKPVKKGFGYFTF